MNKLERIEARIKRLENSLIKNKKETLESRVSKLEKIIFEDNEEVAKSPKDYLMILLNMLFKSKKVNPNGSRLDGNYEFYKVGSYTGVSILNMSIGDWKLNALPDKYNVITDDSIAAKDYGPFDVYELPGHPGEYHHPNTAQTSSYFYNESYELTNADEIKKIVGAFCKINKCIIKMTTPSSGSDPSGTFIQFRLEKSPTFQPPKPRRKWGDSDSDWETLADQERRHNSLYHGWH